MTQKSEETLGTLGFILMTLPANPLRGTTSPDLTALVREAVHSRREESHYDFKVTAPDNAKLLKHIVAMSNLPQDTPGGHAYLIIGVTNDHQVVGLKEEDLRSNPSADKREGFLNSFLRDSVDPDFSVRVHDIALDDSNLHVIEVPCRGWPWRQLQRENESQYGFWVRQGPNSVRPTTAQLAAEWSRKERRLQERVISLDAALTEQRQVALTVLESAPGSGRASQTALQAIQVGFATPERTLHRLVRHEISAYLQAHSDSVDTWTSLPYFQLDRLTTLHPVDVDTETAARVRAAVEGQEEAVRPLVELVGAIMHDAEPTDRVRLAVLEIAQAVAFTTYTTIGTNGATYGALRFHPGYLLCFGACVAALSAPDWTILGIILTHFRSITFPTGATGRWDLIQTISLRPHIDALVLTFDPHSPIAAGAERARNLLEQPDWLGGYMPATMKKRITRHAEVLLLLAYVAHSRPQVAGTPIVDGAWLHYATAQDTLLEALNMIGNRWDAMHDTPLEIVVRQFDDLANTGQWPYRVSAAEALSYVRTLSQFKAR